MNAQNCLQRRSTLGPSTLLIGRSGQAEIAVEGGATPIWLLHFLGTYGQFEFLYL